MQHRLVKLLGAPAPWLMGVVNVTPDSFSDGGLYLAPDAAMAHGRQLLAEGAQILDLAANRPPPAAGRSPARRSCCGWSPWCAGWRARPCCRSTPTMRRRRPAASTGGTDRQRRVGPAGGSRDGGGRARPGAGAGDDARQGRPFAARDRPASALWRRGGGRGRLAGARVEAALAAGIDADQIVLDPGWGKFLSLEPDHSWEMLARFDELVARLAPLPVAVGISRKGFFGCRWPSVIRCRSSPAWSAHRRARP